MLSDDKIVELFETVGEIKSNTESINQKLEQFSTLQEGQDKRIQVIEQDMVFYKKTVKWALSLLFTAGGTVSAWATIKEKVIGIFHHG